MRKDYNDRVNRANTREIEDVPEIPRVSFATVLLSTSANGTQGAYTDGGPTHTLTVCRPRIATRNRQAHDTSLSELPRIYFRLEPET